MELSEHTNGTKDKADLDTLFLVGGVSLMVFGAGLILSNPVVRRYLGQIGVGNLATAARRIYNVICDCGTCKTFERSPGRVCCWARKRVMFA